MVPNYFSFFERVSQIIMQDDLETLLEEALDLLLKACQAASGVLYLPTAPFLKIDSQGMVFKGKARQSLTNQEIPAILRSLLQSAMFRRESIVISSPPDLEDNYPGLTAWCQEARVHNVLVLPFFVAKKSIGAALVFNFKPADVTLLSALTGVLAAGMSRAAQVEAEIWHNQRLEMLIDVLRKVGSTLDREQILCLLINQTQELLSCEAVSLFLINEPQGDLVLTLASDANGNVRFENLRIPPGQGIIGHVVQTGEVVVTSDVRYDPRHYRNVDLSSGFVTRSLLAVPLCTNAVELGVERGVMPERIIGGLEAINKSGGDFDKEDIHLLSTLADQAATVLEIAALYTDSNELFLGVIKSLTAAIDAKDPYTEGHSERVSQFSVAIAKYLNLPPETVHHIRIGALLHDVGKIGIPDAILCKSGSLTEDEYSLIKQHPLIGAKIMGQVRKLQTELSIMAEHQERLDGSGYPRGLREAEISLSGRIVAVADVFDALTSARPYRQPMSAIQALDYLKGHAERFDQECVDALIRAYEDGALHLQEG